MHHINRLALAPLLFVAAVSLVRVVAAEVTPAAEETFTGKIVCAQCTLHKPDAHECQDVLVVKNPKGETAEYYIEKNDVAKKAGEACTDEVPATVTGTVSEKDGKKWIAATKIDKKS